MSDARLRRVNKEIAGASDGHSFVGSFLSALDCKNDKSSKINIDLIDNSPFHLRGSFDGPQDTPYSGGHFEVVRLLPHRPLRPLCHTLPHIYTTHRILSSPIHILSNPSR